MNQCVQGCAEHAQQHGAIGCLIFLAIFATMFIIIPALIVWRQS